MYIYMYLYICCGGNSIKNMSAYNFHWGLFAYHLKN